MAVLFKKYISLHFRGAMGYILRYSKTGAVYQLLPTTSSSHESRLTNRMSNIFHFRFSVTMTLLFLLLISGVGAGILHNTERSKTAQGIVYSQLDGRSDIVKSAPAVAECND
jgi:hypothetical protein